MKAKFAVAAVSIILLLGLPSAFSDVFENFDNYIAGTVSPSSLVTAGIPWTCTVDGNATCGTVSGYAQCFSPSTGVTYIGSGASGKYSPPNVYALYVSNSATCSVNAHSAFTGTHYVQLSALLNLTQTGVIMNFAREASVSTANINATVSLCGSVVLNSFFSGEPSTYTRFNASALGIIGTNCTLSFKLVPIHGASATTGKWLFDNVDVHGGSFIETGANLFMVDNSQTAGLTNVKNQWYNITNYGKSYVELDYASNPPVTYSNLSAPDIPIIYGAATLLKVWVIPSSYFVQIIPNDATANTVWLFNPSIVNTYTINIQDLSNLFGPNSTVQINQGSRVMSSGYTDAQNTYPIWIVPGSYQLTITKGPNVYSTTLNFPSTNGASISVQILKYKQSGNCGQICTISYNAGFSAGGGSIVVTYTDTTATTTSMTDQVWVNTPTGASEFYTKTWASGPYQAITDTIACNSDSCNSTLASSIYVVLIFVNMYGSNQEDIPVSGGSTFANTPNLPQGILCWNCVFPTSPSPLNFAAYIIILLSASSMGALAAKFGVVVVAGEAVVLASAGWLGLADGAGLVLIPLAVLAFVGFLEAGR